GVELARRLALAQPAVTCGIDRRQLRRLDLRRELGNAGLPQPGIKFECGHCLGLLRDQLGIEEGDELLAAHALERMPVEPAAQKRIEQLAAEAQLEELQE